MSVSDAVPGEAIAGLLVARGVLDASDLERARRAAARYGEPLRAVLDKLGLIAQDVWARAAADDAGLDLFSAADLEASGCASDAVTLDFLRAQPAVLLRSAEAEPDQPSGVALADPSDPFIVSALEAATGRTLAVSVALARDIEATLDRLYGPRAAQDEDEPASAGHDAGPTGLEDPGDIERLRGLASEAPVVRLVTQMIQRAIESGASDIHIEPYERHIIIRYRIDGLLSDVDRTARAMGPALVSRIKILANLDIAERRLPQDGRIRHRTEGQEVDLRVATVPSLHGEAVVIRILDQGGPPPRLADLGLTAAQQAVLARHLDRRTGLVLVTGPTGAGKTTTLYAALDRLNEASSKIMTVEDPIEFQVDRVVQIQARPDIGHDFTRILRSVLRQDPDIIMVGEMRDGETARIAAQAALTGHLVLSTLHTNDAPSAVTRLLDMGLEDYLITATVHLAVAQRLVRRLCPVCRREVSPPPEAQHLFEQFGPPEGPVRFYEAVGCAACGGRGYRGRVGLYELFSLDDGARRLVLERGGTAALRAHGEAAGMVPLFADGVVKCAEGLTTMEEVRRVVAAELV